MEKVIDNQEGAFLSSNYTHRDKTNKVLRSWLKIAIHALESS